MVANNYYVPREEQSGGYAILGSLKMLWENFADVSKLLAFEDDTVTKLSSSSITLFLFFLNQN